MKDIIGKNGNPTHNIVKWLNLGFVAILSGIVFCFAHIQSFTNYYVISDDIRQQIYWMQSWHDPELFQGDLLTDYARHYVPWGVKGLYWLASWIMSPITFSKVLPGLLFIFLAICIYKIMQSILGNQRPAWVAVATFWLMPFFLNSMSGGLARSFAAPLLALFLLCWLNNRLLGMGIALILQSLFIPYIFPVAAGSVLLAWVVSKFSKKRLPFQSQWVFTIMLIIGASIVILFNKSFADSGYGPLVSAIDMKGHPEFTRMGRYAIVPLTSFRKDLFAPFFGFFPDGLRKIGGLSCIIIFGLTLYGNNLKWRTIQPKLNPFFYITTTSLVFYFLARFLLLKLFIPDRYLSYTLNLFFCLGLSWCVAIAFKIQKWPRSLAILAIVLTIGLGVWRLHGIGLVDFSEYRPLYAALSQTPKDAIIAGHPNLMDNVPTFAQRRAFVTYELSHPWAKGYWQKIEPRLYNFFDAYYAKYPDQVIAFSRKYLISFIVVDDRHFSEEFLSGNEFRTPFFAPFDTYIKRQTAGRRDFAILSFPSLKVDEHIRILDMRPYLK